MQKIHHFSSKGKTDGIILQNFVKETFRLVLLMYTFLVMTEQNPTSGNNSMLTCFILLLQGTFIFLKHCFCLLTTQNLDFFANYSRAIKYLSYLQVFSLDIFNVDKVDYLLFPGEGSYFCCIIPRSAFSPSRGNLSNLSSKI